ARLRVEGERVAALHPKARFAAGVEADIRLPAALRERRNGVRRARQIVRNNSENHLHIFLRSGTELAYPFVITPATSCPAREKSRLCAANRQENQFHSAKSRC